MRDPVDYASAPHAIDDQFIYLDEADEWVLWLPNGSSEAVVVHAHGPTADHDEWLFIECDAVDGPNGLTHVRCPDCGAEVPEAQIDAWIEALPDADPE